MLTALQNAGIPITAAQADQVLAAEGSAQIDVIAALVSAVADDAAAVDAIVAAAVSTVAGDAAAVEAIVAAAAAAAPSQTAAIVNGAVAAAPLLAANILTAVTAATPTAAGPGNSDGNGATTAQENGFRGIGRGLPASGIPSGAGGAGASPNASRS
jgi:hypothetical protein